MIVCNAFMQCSIQRSMRCNIQRALQVVAHFGSKCDRSRCDGEILSYPGAVHDG